MILIRTLLSVSASASTCRFCSTCEAAFKGNNRGKPSDKTKYLGSPKLLDLLLSSFLLFRRLKLPGPPLPQIKIVHEEEEEEEEEKLDGHTLPMMIRRIMMKTMRF